MCHLTHLFCGRVRGGLEGVAVSATKRLYERVVDLLQAKTCEVTWI